MSDLKQYTDASAIRNPVAKYSSHPPPAGFFSASCVEVQVTSLE